MDMHGRTYWRARAAALLLAVLSAGLLLAACGGESNEAENETRCDDGVDNDFDDRVDCRDPDCARAPVCLTEHCYNLVDDDKDGDTDCADDECDGISVCLEIGEHCVSGRDDDRDGDVDCADSDCALTYVCLPDGENCTNGVDDDGDGDVDCQDTDCEKTAVCQPRAEDCENGADDDADGDVDCDDVDCATTSMCSAGAEVCKNGSDDDGDGRIDCADADCAHTATCLPLAEACANGADDDGDGDIDCDDSYCSGSPECSVGVEMCKNWVDDDGDGDVDCEDTDCATRAPCLGEALCDDGEDNDDDGVVDCQDPDCGPSGDCYALELVVNGTGLVQTPAGDTSCESTCTLRGQAGEVELLAVGTGQNNFLDWSVCPSSNGLQCVVDAQGRQQLSVTFTPLSAYTLPGIAGCSGEDGELAVLQEIRHDALGASEEATEVVGLDGALGMSRSVLGVDEAVGHFNVFGRMNFVANHVCVAIEGVTAEMRNQGYNLYAGGTTPPHLQPRTSPPPQNVAAPTSTGFQLIELATPLGPTQQQTWVGVIFPDSGGDKEMGAAPGATQEVGESWAGTYDADNNGTGFEQFDFQDYASFTNATSSNRAVIRLQQGVPRTTTYSLDIIASGPGSIEVVGTEDTCTAACAYDYSVLKEVVLRARPDANASFQGWAECDAVYGDYCMLRMTRDRVIDAAFQ